MGSRKNRSERAFGWLLRLFPFDFRDQFETEMSAAFRAEHAEILRRGGALRWTRFWWRSAAGVFSAAPREHWDNLRLDLRLALRLLRKRPLFTVTAALSLAVGIGAATTAMTVFHALFIRAIPGIEQPDRLVNLHLRTAGDEAQRTSYPNFVDLRRYNQALSDLAGFNGLPVSLSLTEQAEPELIAAQVVSWNYFSVLTVRPQRGRLLSAEDDRVAQPVAVISDWLWRQRLGGDPAALGRTIRVNGAPLNIVGITPPGFRGHFVGFNFDVFIPTSMAAVAGLPERGARGAHWVELVGRLRPGVSLQQAAAHLGLTARRLAEAHPRENRGLEIQLERHSGIDADLRGGLLVFVIALIAVSAFVLLIACVNVANMMLARAVWRRKEMALRLALGAKRGRLARQLLTESAVLALLAGALGCLLALWATDLMRSSIPAFGGLITLDVRLDEWSLLAACGVSLASALLFGLAPAHKASRADLAAVLKHSGDSKHSATSLGGLLVIGQVALSLVVLICAGLLLRALHRATGIDPGFSAAQVTSASLDPQLIGMDEPESRAYFERLKPRIEVLPRVESACLVRRVPLSLGARFFPNPVEVAVPGWEPLPEREGFPIEHSVVSDGYFETLRIPILEGRGFAFSDTRETGRVAVVNQSFAQRFFRDSGAVGRVVRIEGQDVAIVGVARDSKYRSLDEQPLALVYLPLAQHFRGSAVLLVRSEPGAAGFAAALRDRIREHSPYLPIREFGPLEDQLAIALMPQRIAGAVAGSLGLIGLLLTAVGLYGVVGYAVSRRSSEIGVRMSLGARPSDVVRMVLGQGLRLALIGIGVGIPAATFAGRLLDVFLVGLSPLDAPTYSAIATLLLATALLASYIPARRAARIDPLTVLRSE